ncbi:hypothetical protein chiPu_0027895 [Chiloscyllium punctatum]|uniref:Uncharacterized protein n=1 Tax=Chiloscyllium punctatum TaxID=137246 RepID=A0A401TMG9_CHIPU|nr:hypothetical protein [Chiloscyllium punctatum]
MEEEEGGGPRHIPSSGPALRLAGGVRPERESPAQPARLAPGAGDNGAWRPDHRGQRDPGEAGGRTGHQHDAAARAAGAVGQEQAGRPLPHVLRAAQAQTPTRPGQGWVAEPQPRDPPPQTQLRTPHFGHLLLMGGGRRGEEQCGRGVGWGGGEDKRRPPPPNLFPESRNSRHSGRPRATPSRTDRRTMILQHLGLFAFPDGQRNAASTLRGGWDQLLRDVS